MRPSLTCIDWALSKNHGRRCIQACIVLKIKRFTSKTLLNQKWRNKQVDLFSKTLKFRLRNQNKLKTNDRRKNHKLRVNSISNKIKINYLYQLTFCTISPHPPGHTFLVTVTVACIMTKISASRLAKLGAIEAVVVGVAADTYAVFNVGHGAVSTDRMPIE